MQVATVIMTPGTNPVKNSPCSEQLLIMLKRIMPMLGGMITPRFPEVVMSPTL